MLKRLTPLILALVFIGQVCVSNLYGAVDKGNYTKAHFAPLKTAFVISHLDPAENEEWEEDELEQGGEFLFLFYNNICALPKESPVLLAVSDDRLLANHRQPLRESICVFRI